MNPGDPVIDIMVKRERLLARCAAQRDELSSLAVQFATPLKVADRAVAAVDFLRRHPLVLVVAGAFFAAVERRRSWTWVKRGFVVWRSYRALRDTHFKSAG